jgi:hypothetical protein
MATAPKKTTAVVEKPAASAVVPFDAAMMQADAGIGREAMGVTDMALPYWVILQSLSPQVKKSSPTRIEDAEEGDIFNTVTQDLVDGEQGLEIIPCAFSKAWVEWAPRDSGGGFITSHATDEMLNRCDRNEQGFDVRKDNGHIIVATYYYYSIELSADGPKPCLIAMSRTQMKKARKWNSLISSMLVPGPNGSFNPPMFAQRFHLSTEPESNAKGDWYSWKIVPKGLVADAELYNRAKIFAQQVRDGLVKAAPPPSDSLPDDDDAPM